MKKKILFIMNSNIYSGAEKVNISIINSIKDQYDFYWVSKDGKINDVLKKNDIKHITIKKLTISEIKRVIKEYNPDILHATDYKSSCICSVAKGKTYLIEHLHNNAPWLKKICLQSIAFLFAGLRADVILIVSQSIKNEYIFSKYIKDKIINIGNPVSAKEILNKISKDDYEKKYEICCVGRLTEAKNPYKFLEIINKITNQMPNIKAVWVGDGELKTDILSKCIKMKINKNIDFVGFHNNPYKYMANSKVFVLTSNWEGYGLVAFEALTLGLPCVVSNVGGLPDIVDESCGKLCENEDDFIKEIVNLLTDEKKLKEKSESALIKSKKLDNINEYMKKLEKIYKSI